MNATPSLLVQVREGATAPLQFILGRTVDRAFAVENLTGFGEIILFLKSVRDETEKSFPLSDGKITVTSATEGKISFIRDEDDFLYLDREYEGYFRATDPSGKDIDYPEGGVIIFKVQRQNA